MDLPVCTYMEKMAFSVIPSSAVAQAKTKMRMPKKTWAGMYEVRRCEASPGKRKVTRPQTHCMMNMMTVAMPSHECRLYMFGPTGLFTQKLFTLCDV